MTLRTAAMEDNMDSPLARLLAARRETLESFSRNLSDDIKSLQATIAAKEAQMAAYRQEIMEIGQIMPAHIAVVDHPSGEGLAIRLADGTLQEHRDNGPWPSVEEALDSYLEDDSEMRVTIR